MPAEEKTDRSATDLGPSRRRRALRTERGSTQALLIAAIPLLVLLVIVVVGAWIMRAESRKQEASIQASIPTPTHLPTLRPATLIAVSKTATATVAPVGVEVEATATTEPTATATEEPTATPAAAEPTATPEVPDDALAAGVTAQVTGTAGSGLRIRGSAGLGGPTVKVVPEGTLLTILDGPQDADGYQWYQVRDEVGAEGWVAGDWLVRSK